jgi:hypothetical protein
VGGECDTTFIIMANKENFMKRRESIYAGVCALAVLALVISACNQPAAPASGALAANGASDGQVVIVPEPGVTIIAEGAYANRSEFRKVTIRDGVTSIGKNAFEWCTSMTSLSIPDSVTTIGDGAFEWCRSLTWVKIPKSVTSIGDSAFSNCWELTGVTIPKGIASIGRRTFYECRNLSLWSGDIPDSVTTIGDWAFEGCEKLTSVTIPNSVKTIGDYAFYYCQNLAGITIGANVVVDETSFRGCPGDFSAAYAAAGTYRWNGSDWRFNTR